MVCTDVFQSPTDPHKNPIWPDTTNQHHSQTTYQDIASLATEMAHCRCGLITVVTMPPVCTHSCFCPGDLRAELVSLPRLPQLLVTLPQANLLFQNPVLISFYT